MTFPRTTLRLFCISPRACFLLALAGGAIAASNSPERLIFDRTLILDGQFWRLWSGHWVHLTTQHLVLNLLAGCLILFLMPKPSPRDCAFLAGILPVALSLGLLAFRPNLDCYAGLSGWLCGALMFLACTKISSANPATRRIYQCVLALFFLKSAIELGTRQSLIVHTFTTEHFAHLLGAGIAAAWVAAATLHNHSRGKNRSGSNPRVHRPARSGIDCAHAQVFVPAERPVLARLGHHGRQPCSRDGTTSAERAF